MPRPLRLASRCYLSILFTERQAAWFTTGLTTFDSAVAEDLFEKLLFKEVNGEKIERRTTVNHAMKSARTAWNTIYRKQPTVGPAEKSV